MIWLDLILWLQWDPLYEGVFISKLYGITEYDVSRVHNILHHDIKDYTNLTARYRRVSLSWTLCWT